MRPNDYGGAIDGAATILGMTPIRLLAAALTAAFLLTSACGAKDDAPKDTAPSSSSPKTASAELIEYDKQDAAGVSIAKAAEVSMLKGAPDDFKQFIAGIIDSSKTLPEDDCQFTVGVAKIDTSGFAAGSMHSCGGAAYIWAKRDGVWQEIWSGQEYPACADMKKYSVPKAIAYPTCYDGNEEIDYTG